MKCTLLVYIYYSVHITSLLFICSLLLYPAIFSLPIHQIFMLILFFILFFFHLYSICSLLRLFTFMVFVGYYVLLSLASLLLLKIEKHEKNAYIFIYMYLPLYPYHPFPPSRSPPFISPLLYPFLSSYFLGLRVRWTWRRCYFLCRSHLLENRERKTADRMSDKESDKAVARGSNMAALNWSVNVSFRRNF